MPKGYTYAHCLWLMGLAYTDDVAKPDTFDVLLYDDEIDQLGFDADLGDITTEPDTGNYSRATMEFPADLEIQGDRDSGYVHVDPVGVNFDFENVTGEVSHAGVVWNAQLPDDSAQTQHLMARCELYDRHELGDYTGVYTVKPGWQIHTLF